MTLRRLGAVAGLELRSNLGRPILWILLLLLALITISLNPTALMGSGDPAVGGTKPFTTSQHAMAWLFAMSGFLAYLFFTAIVAGLAVVRDDEYKLSDLIHSTRLSSTEYVCGKLLGVVAVFMVVLTAHTILTVLWYQFGPLDDPLQRGPFGLANYVVPALVFSGPLIWASTGLAFAVGEWQRRPLATFAVPVSLFLAILFFMTWRPTGLDPVLDWTLMILDPSGLRWLRFVAFGADRGVDFYNTAPLPFDATFGLNRLLIIAAPFLVVMFSIRHCRAMISAGGVATDRSSRWLPTQWLARKFVLTKELESSLVEPKTPGRIRSLGSLEMRTTPPSFLASTLLGLRSELVELRAQPGLVLFTGLTMALVWEIGASATGVFGAPLLLTPGVLAVRSLSMLTTLLLLMVLFFTVESLMRERVTGLQAILFACPFPTASMLMAKNLAGAVFVGVQLVAATGVALALLVLRGAGSLDLGPLAWVWGLILPPTLWLWSAFITAVFAVTRDRYTTYGIGLSVWIVSLYHLRLDSATWVTNWTLGGTLRWSDMGFLELNGEAVLLNRLMVVAVAVFLTVFANRRFARVEPDAVSTPGRSRWRTAFGLVLLALPAIVLGGLLSAQVRAGFQSESAEKRAKDYWRRNVATWRDFTPAAVTHVDLEVELEPAERSLAVVGVYTMQNRTNEAMSRLPFTVDPTFEDVAWTLGGVAVAFEDRSGLHVIQPDHPLQPGAVVDVGFSFRGIRPRGFTKNGRGVGQFILPSGVALHTLRDSFLPVPGYLHNIGVDSDNASDAPELDEEAWRRDLASAAVGTPFTSSVAVTAPSEYTVNSVGDKVTEIRHDGRTTVVWESGVPVRAINIVAGRWDVRREGGTAVFFHPGHPYNVDAILETMVAARQRYSDWFAPYPWEELKLSEFPDLVTNAQGFPTNIPFSESIGFLMRSDPGTRPAFLVTAHEVAHQWWANILSAGEGPGTGHLVEGMAHFSALLLHESEFGQRGRIELAKRLETNYGRFRRVDTELPIIEMVDDQELEDWTVVYEKGAWVQWMLHNHLGREQALAGLQTFIHQFREGQGPAEGQPAEGQIPANRPTTGLPTTQDMLAALRPFAADAEAYDAFVDQLFFDIVLPQYRIRDAEILPIEAGWQVTATVENVGSGSFFVDLSVASRERFPGDAREPSPDYLEQRLATRLEPGKPQQVSWEVSFEPAELRVDPDVLVLQRHRDQAVLSLKGR